MRQVVEVDSDHGRTVRRYNAIHRLIFYIDISVFSDMSARPRFVVSPYLPTTYVKKKCKIYYFFYFWISGFSFKYRGCN